jgi:hypothetical protein
MPYVCWGLELSIGGGSSCLRVHPSSLPIDPQGQGPRGTWVVTIYAGKVPGYIVAGDCMPFPWSMGRWPGGDSPVHPLHSPTFDWVVGVHKYGTWGCWQTSTRWSPDPFSYITLTLYHVCAWSLTILYMAILDMPAPLRIILSFFVFPLSFEVSLWVCVTLSWALSCLTLVSSSGLLCIHVIVSMSILDTFTSCHTPKIWFWDVTRKH